MQKSILILLVCVLCEVSFGQQTDNIKEDQFKKIYITSAEYFFEGTVLEKRPYVDTKGRFITSVKVQVHRVFKGTLSLGTVEMLIPGEGTYIDQKTGKEYTETVITDGEWTAVEIGNTYAFNCKTATASASGFNAQYANTNRLRMNTLFSYLLKYDREPLRAKIAVLPALPTPYEKYFYTVQQFYDYVTVIPGFSLKMSDGKEFIKDTIPPKPLEFGNDPKEANPDFYKYTIAPSENIFEGTVTDIVHYVGTDKKKYDACIIQIHKVFKGSLVPGKISILRYTTVNSGPLEVETVDGGHELSIGDVGMFFCNKSSLDEIKPSLKVTLENPVGQSPRDWAFYGLRSFPFENIVGIGGGMWEIYPYKGFKKIADFYTFLLSFPGITKTDFDHKIFERAKPPVYNHPPDTTRLNHLDPVQNHKEYEKAVEQLRQRHAKAGGSKKKVLNGNNSPSSAADSLIPMAMAAIEATELTYTFENATYTGTDSSHAFLEFDVSLVSSPDKYLDAAMAEVQFNPQVFGDSIIKNGAVTITRGTLVTDDDYFFYYDDHNPNSFRVLTYTQTRYPNRSSVDETPRQMCHVKMKIKDCMYHKTLITFTNQADMFTFSLYADQKNQDYLTTKNYDAVVALDSENYLACAPVIDDFSPRSIQAGTGDQLTITGRFFGTTQGIGNVYFHDANDKDLHYNGVNSGEIISWSDNEIIVKVPSVTTPVSNFTGRYPTPGSGTFLLQNKFSGIGFTDPDTLLIRYALNTDTTTGKNRYHLVGNNASGEFVFNVDQEVFDNKAAMQSIQAALKEWTCVTHINWRIGQVTKSDTGYNKGDLISTIYFADAITFTDSATLMQTPRTRCSSSSPFSPSADIRIKRNPLKGTWNFNMTKTTGLNQYNFFNSILHELGHAHQLEHTNNRGDIMFRSQNLGQQKRSLVQDHDAAGGSDVMTFSISKTPSGCGSTTMTEKSLPDEACNHSQANKLVLNGISISCLCAPGSASNGANPILLPTVTGGVPPYTYIWEALPDNTTTLDVTNSATPMVTAATDSLKVHYKLTVYDNSDTVQYASHEAEYLLRTSQTYDYAMRDSYLDRLNEPNNQYTYHNQQAWQIYDSPDIWNRNDAASTSTEQENPEYTQGIPNYLHVRIRNIGCVAPPTTANKLRVYWTLSSTGEKWDSIDAKNDWKSGTFAGQPAGQEITNDAVHGTSPITLPILNPGEDQIITQAWYPPKPQIYDTLTNHSKLTADVCVLARIENTSTYPFGMHYRELSQSTSDHALSQNVRNNNDIITRNLIVENFRAGKSKHVRHQILIANPYVHQDVMPGAPTHFDIRLITDNTISTSGFSALGNVVLDLGREVYTRWIMGGAQGSGFSMIPGTTELLATDPNNFIIKNIFLAAGEKKAVTVQLNQTVSLSVQNNEVLAFSISQYVTNESTALGAVNFRMNILGNEVAQNFPNRPDETDHAESATERQITGEHTAMTDLSGLTVYPNPTNAKLNIELYLSKETNIQVELSDLLGRVIEKMESQKVSGRFEKIVDMSELSNGLYMLTIRAGEQTIMKKVVKE